MILRGIDGCPEGWIAASLDLTTGQVTGEVFRDAASLLRDPRAVVTAIPFQSVCRAEAGLAVLMEKRGACLGRAGAASFPHHPALFSARGRINQPARLPRQTAASS